MSEVFCGLHLFTSYSTCLNNRKMQSHHRKYLIGWDIFLLGRICYHWESIPFRCVDGTNKTNMNFFPKIWKAIYKYLKDLWRARFYYVAEIKIWNEQQTWDEQIVCMCQKDISKLPRIDRSLFDEKHIPTVNSTPYHKKFWLFKDSCAFKKLSFMIDPDQPTLFDYGFATFNPV